jgi:hypothetical protein
MDGLLRDGVDLQAFSGKSFIGDAYLFEEVTTPAKIKELLDSFKVPYLFEFLLIFLFYFPRILIKLKG